MSGGWCPFVRLGVQVRPRESLHSPFHLAVGGSPGPPRRVPRLLRRDSLERLLGQRRSCAAPTQRSACSGRRSSTFSTMEPQPRTTTSLVPEEALAHSLGTRRQSLRERLTAQQRGDEACSALSMAPSVLKHRRESLVLGAQLAVLLPQPLDFKSCGLNIGLLSSERSDCA